MRKITIIAVCVMLAIVYGCDQKPVTKKPIKISLDVWPGYGLAYLAQEKGFFRKNNVEVELLLKKSSPESKQSFISGEADGCFDVLADVIMTNARGLSAKIVYVVDFSTSGDVIIGRPDVQSLAELKGKTVGFEGINTFSHIFVLKALQKAGVTESNARFENINAHDVLAALEEGKIDAGHTWEPTKSQAIAKGYKILAKAGYIPGIITDVLVFSSKIIDGRPDDVRAVVRSLLEARDYLEANRDEAVKIMARRMGMSETEMVEGLDGMYQPDGEENLSLLTGKTVVSMPSLHASGEMIADFYLKRGQLSSSVDFNAIFEPKFIREPDHP